MSWVFAPPSKRSNRCEISQTDIFQGPAFTSPLLVIRVVEFSREGYWIRKILGKKTTYPKKITEFWELVWWGRCQKVPTFDFQSQFSLWKIIGIILISFSFKNANLRAHFFHQFLSHFITVMMSNYWQLATTPILKIL